MNSLFKKFYRKIKLTKKQREDARTKFNSVCKKLHSHYYVNTEYNGKTKLLIGSYAKKTNIRPPRDVDVIFIMPKEEFDRYDNYESNGQNQLLQDIRTLLKDRYKTTDKIKGWGKVILIEFAEGKHNIELLPAWRNDNNTFTIPNSSDGGNWEIWDPLSEIGYVNESNKNTNGLTIEIIRMIKKWTEYCNVSIKSYQIEIYVIEFLFNYDYENNFSYSHTINDFFKFIKQKNSDDEIDSKIDSAISRSGNACSYEEQNDKQKACEIWQKVFGYDFNKTLKKELNKEIKNLNQEYPTVKEEFLISKYGIHTQIDESFKLKINANIEIDGGFMHNTLSDFLSKSWLLSKMKSITFFITENNIPKPYDIYWKVRNYGKEAYDAKDLRGEISEDSGSQSKEEHTKYTGVHYVKCYIVKDNICVASAIIKVPIDN